MDILERLRKYADKVPDGLVKGYDMRLDELSALCRTARACSSDGIDMVCLAFDYGRAKGYRAAKAEARRAAV